MNIVVGFVIGGLAGLLIRPVLDAYLLWRMADWFRREPSTSSHEPEDVDVDHRTGV